jgi:hypothetical protein
VQFPPVSFPVGNPNKPPHQTESNMNRLEQIRQGNLKIKAAKLLNRKPNQIVKVVETIDGASVECKDGNHLNIPNRDWIGYDI